MAEAEAGLGAALMNVAAKINVGVTLADPAIKKIVFDQGGMVVRPSCFAEVAKAITADRIKVVVVKTLSTTGVYDAAVDSIELKSAEVTSIPRKALIVHECLHAWMDIAAIKNMKVKTSEAAAYLAQCIFARSKASDPTDEEYRLYSEDEKMDKVFAKAWSMAGDVVMHQTNPASSDFTDLESLVEATKKYSHEANSNAKWNGVPAA